METLIRIINSQKWKLITEISQFATIDLLREAIHQTKTDEETVQRPNKKQKTESAQSIEPSFDSDKVMGFG